MKEKEFVLNGKKIRIQISELGRNDETENKQEFELSNGYGYTAIDEDELMDMIFGEEQEELNQDIILLSEALNLSKSRMKSKRVKEKKETKIIKSSIEHTIKLISELNIRNFDYSLAVSDIPKLIKYGQGIDFSNEDQFLIMEFYKSGLLDISVWPDGRQQVSMKYSGEFLSYLANTILLAIAEKQKENGELTQYVTKGELIKYILTNTK